jgi:hypothetical protein
VTEPGTELVRAQTTAITAHAGEAGAVALAAQVEANVKARTFLALQRPRNWTDVRSRLLSAFERPVLCEGAIYSKPIGTKKVEGLSIRFAEEAFRAIGNLTIDTVLVSDDDGKRVYMVQGIDLETNATFGVTVVVTKTIERSSPPKDAKLLLDKRTNSQGNPTYIIRALSEDDYRSKEQAQLQKARRDVILFLTPGDIQEEAEAKIRETLRKRDREDPLGAVNRIADAFFKYGVTAKELEEHLGHELRTTNEAELHVLRTLFVGLREGEYRWADVVRERTKGKREPSEGASSLQDAIDATKGEAKAEPKGEAKAEAEPAPAPADPPPAPAAPEPPKDPKPEPSKFALRAMLKRDGGKALTAEESEAIRDHDLDLEAWKSRHPNEEAK